MKTSWIIFHKHFTLSYTGFRFTQSMLISDFFRILGHLKIQLINQQVCKVPFSQHESNSRLHACCFLVSRVLLVFSLEHAAMASNNSGHQGRQHTSHWSEMVHINSSPSVCDTTFETSLPSNCKARLFTLTCVKDSIRSVWFHDSGLIGGGGMELRMWYILLSLQPIPSSWKIIFKWKIYKITDFQYVTMLIFAGPFCFSIVNCTFAIFWTIFL